MCKTSKFKFSVVYGKTSTIMHAFFHPDGLVKHEVHIIHTGLLFCQFIITFCSLQTHQKLCIVVEHTVAYFQLSIHAYSPVWTLYIAGCSNWALLQCVRPGTLSLMHMVKVSGFLL